MADPLLATVDDLGLLVGEDLASADPKAQLLLRTASAIVRGSKPGTGQYLSTVVDDLVYIEAIASATGFLSEFPIREVTLVERQTPDGWVALDATSYDIDRRTGRIRLHRWPSHYSAEWRVTYTHGFDDIPDGISGAVLGLASRAWEIPIGVDNERIGQRSIKYLMLDSGFLPHEANSLAEYRRPEVR